ncbi:MAG: GntR family transcriptional regulator [Pseudomonadota bacterium]
MTQASALPMYVQIAESLIRDIAAGRFLDGERLAPERRMASDLGISVGTLRKALADLENRGLLDRVQGSGNYVRSENAADAGIYAMFRLELKDGGGLPTADVMSVARMPKPADTPDFGPSHEGHRIRRLRRLSGQPAALEEIWLDGNRVQKITRADLLDSLYLFYRRTLGLVIARVEDRISVRNMPDWGGSMDLVPAGAPCGYIERVSTSQDGQPVEFSRTWYDATRVHYVSRLK